LTAPLDKPRRKRLTADERRQAILDAALDVFARRGYHAASIDEIAQAAGISKALIYEHFPSKRDLHVSLLEAEVRVLFARLVESAATPEPGEVRLRQGVDAFLGWVDERSDAFRMLFRDAVEPEVAGVVGRLQMQATTAIAELIAREPLGPQPEGQDRDETIEMLAQLLSGAVQSLALWWQEHGGVSRERLVDVIMDFCWKGLERVRDEEREHSRRRAAEPAGPRRAVRGRTGGLGRG
jgi:AcrR family transcriptional regulator